MTSLLLPVVTGESSSAARLPVAVNAHLARYRGRSRDHTASDLRVFLLWCAERDLDPLAAQRAHLELHVRWCQEVRRFKPSTVSRPTSVVCGFYRTCVIDGRLEHSPAQWLRRPTVPPESPTLGLTHLQFEALLTAARESANVNDFALVAMLGLLGLRIFEACAPPTSPTSGRSTATGCCGWSARAPESSSCRCRPRSGGRSTRAVDGRADGPLLRNRRGARMDRHAATRRLRHLADQAGVRLPRMHPHMLRHTFVTTMLDAGVDLRDVQIAARHADPRTTMRYDRARKNLDRHPNYILAAYMASGN
ncbi:MAG TPA: tyrosine-type recombinase/integrase [Jiangellales bacterium]|nr:tyrosine-type recombinase/integrase [Jiangellales bacterium]